MNAATVTERLINPGISQRSRGHMSTCYDTECASASRIRAAIFEVPSPPLIRTALEIREHREHIAVRVVGTIEDDLEMPLARRIAAVLGEYQYCFVPRFLRRCERVFTPEGSGSLEDWTCSVDSLSRPTLLAVRILRDGYSVDELASRLASALRLAKGTYEYRVA